MAELRLAEIPAIVKLDETSKTATFAKSMAATAAQMVALCSVCTHILLFAHFAKEGNAER